MVWYPMVGYAVFWLGLLASIIIYLVKSKWYPILYLISVSSYIFTVCFVIDVFDFSKNAILLTLAFSALVMIGMGFYLSKKKFAK